MGGVTYNYVYVGSTLTDVTWGNNTLHFVYDALGATAVVYNGTTYYYLRNAQGDITGLVNTSGAPVVSYTYDAWGKLLSTTGTMASTLGVDNPLRYRGYVYDTETRLYYLMSRYYNPTWGRFINADIFVSTGQGIVGNNMFAYCGNNPVNRVDPSGTFFGTIVGAIGGAIGGYINAKLNGDDPLKGALIGAGTGALAGLAVDFAVATGGIGGVVIAVAGGAIAGGLDSGLNDVANGRSIDYEKAGISAAVGGATNLLSFGLVDSSTLKSGGNILKNFVHNGTKQLLKNTTRFVAGKAMSKSLQGVTKNIFENVLEGSIEAAVVSSFSALFNKKIYMMTR